MLNNKNNRRNYMLHNEANKNFKCLVWEIHLEARCFT